MANTGGAALSRREGAHHIGGGWYLHRGDGGTVTIWAGEEDVELTVDAAAWAKAVAAASASGNTGPTYRLALALHEGHLP